MIAMSSYLDEHLKPFFLKVSVKIKWDHISKVHDLLFAIQLLVMVEEEWKIFAEKATHSPIAEHRLNDFCKDRETGAAK